MSENNENAKTITLTVGPLTPLGMLLGCLIQCGYGWHQPVDALDMLWMGFHIFLEPTIMWNAVAGVLIIIPLILASAIMLIGVVLRLFNKT